MPATAVVLIAPLKVVVPVPPSCVREVAVIAWVVMLFALVKVNAARGVGLPKAPFNMILAPPAVRLTVCAPDTLLDNVIFPVDPV
jgi:hypothetical protein